MRRAILFLILAVAPALHAQTVSPVISEYGKKASGEFSVTNNGLTPLAVVVEAQSFSVDPNGKGTYRQLDPGTQVRLSETSTRLGPNESHIFEYRITCAAVPCAVTIWSTLTGQHTNEGIALAIHIPHVAYVCEKEKGCRASVRKAWGLE